VLSDVNTNSLGQATIDIWPDVRNAPSDNAIVVVGDAKGLFRLSSNSTDWSIDQASIYGITFAALEAIV
jgi:hypothetical protein